MFRLVANFKPTGDQPQAIERLSKNIKSRIPTSVFLGVTGSGKTFSIANVIEKTQLPTLVVSHNKALAAQLYQEFKGFFPENAVHYFVSYYDYYQPEAYIPQTDTYIEKDAKISQEIDRLRHAAVQDLLLRRDIIVVASVSCIYNLGSPENYQRVALEIRAGKKIKRGEFLRYLVDLQYQRNDYDFKPGTFRARGETVEIYLVTGQKILRIEFFGDKIDKIFEEQPSHYPGDRWKNKTALSQESAQIFPAVFWPAEENKLKIAIENIRTELQERLEILKKQKKLLEAQRLKQRTNYDLEMLKEAGYCHGIENYSRHIEFREPGKPPFTLLDYFSYSGHSDKNLKRSDYLVIIDESHMTIPQLRAMYNTDKARKEVLIEYGFRLPSALDNRPLRFEEFEKKVGPVIYVSATPGKYELKKIQNQKPKVQKKPKALNSKLQTKNSLLVEQLVRPTGLLEPSVEIRPTKNQVADLIEEIKKRSAKNQRTLCITLTKQLAEDLSEHLKEEGIKAAYLHSNVKTLERPAILQKLREGKIDALVGINLLREGLDLPEVALIGIFDADKEGFLRNQTTLIQTMGRAARHPEGRVILYADKVTNSIKSAIKEIERRRKIQIAYNKKHNIVPQPVIKEIKEWGFGKKEAEVGAEFAMIQDIKLLEKEMKTAAQNLDFERAAKIRGLILQLRLGSSPKNRRVDK